MDVCASPARLVCVQRTPYALLARRIEEISMIVLIVLSSIAAMLARTMVKHSLVIAALMVASTSWAGPSSADARRQEQPDRWTALNLAQTTDACS